MVGNTSHRSSIIQVVHQSSQTMSTLKITYFSRRRPSSSSVTAPLPTSSTRSRILNFLCIQGEGGGQLPISAFDTNAEIIEIIKLIKREFLKLKGNKTIDTEKDA